MPDNMPCPELDELERFTSGELDNEMYRSVEAHVTTCADCGGRLTEIVENLRLIEPIQALGQTLRTSSPSLPERIGRYRVLRVLGRGGMGVVYEAEQDTPRRTVALKMIRPDFTSPQYLRRFTHELEILGRLKHPGIAQIYDAGMADTGQGLQPYFAMELVRGANLRSYVHGGPNGSDFRRAGGRKLSPQPSGQKPDGQELGMRARLELMGKVCDAVQHAHQKGVIHRDLNPNNILVEDDGQPKVLDFGVARMTDADLQTTTLRTDIGQLIGTVPYMSPEHVSGDPAELDTRSDVYSLGVITYELLTDRLPYQLNSRLIPEALRVIRDEQPASMSSIDRVFRGDLNTIVTKALEKDKARRYQSAAELATDIRRYLRHEPIMAQPPSAAYQFRKFAARNAALVWATVAVFLALTAGAAVTTWQAVRATRALDVAEANELRAVKEAAKFKAVNEFLREILAAADPENTPGNPAIIETVRRAAAKIDEGSLADQPEIEAAVRAVIGNTYRALADFDAAERQLRKAVEIGRSVCPQGEDLAFALNKLARLLDDTGHYDEAEPLMRDALAMRQQLHGNEHPDVATAINNLGVMLWHKNELEKAEQLLAEALTMRRRLLGNEHVEVASSLNNLGLLLVNIGRNDEAEMLLRESLAIDRKLREDVHPNVATTMGNLGVLLFRRGELEEAERLLQESLAMRRQIFDEEHPDIAEGLNNLALVNKTKGQLDEAERLYRESLAMERRLRGDRHPRVANTLHNLARLVSDQGEVDLAESMYKEALDIQKEVLGEQHPATLKTLFGLAQLFVGQNRHTEAEPLFARAAGTARESLPAGHWMTGVFLRGYGECLTELARLDEAEATLLKAHEILHSAKGPEHGTTSQAIRALVTLYEAWDKPEARSQWQALMREEE